MIYKQTKVRIVDNSGGRLGKCIQVYLTSERRGGRGGSLILVTIKVRVPYKKIKQGELCKCLVVRATRPLFRITRELLKFDFNAVVILGQKALPRATRIFGPTYRELRIVYMKVVSLASYAL